MLRKIARIASLFFVLASGSADAVTSEGMLQFHADSSTRLGDLTSELERRLPDVVVVTGSDDITLVSYNGNSVPPSLAEFLAAAFPELDPSLIAPGKMVGLAAVLSDTGWSTEMSLMVLARIPRSELALPEGARVMLDGTGPGPCRGQLVIEYPLGLETAAQAFLRHFEKAGFSFPDAAPDETSFFIGYAPDCALALYFQDAGGVTVAVARFLED